MARRKKKTLSKLKEYKFSNINFRLLLYVVCLTVIGILAIGSATSGGTEQKKQILGFVMGIIILIILSLVSYKFVFKFYWLAYIFNLVLLVYVKLNGDVNKGAGRWIDLKFMQFQPSELSKIILILFLAAYLYKHRNTINTFRTIASTCALAGLPIALIVVQPDLSTTIVIFITFCVIMFLSGISYKIVKTVLIIAIPLASVFVYVGINDPNSGILQGYQLKRIVGFYSKDSTDPDIIDTRRQQENSLLAIGSGGLTGKGLNNNTVTSVKNGNLLSESHTDFIFAIIGEELGFAGSAAVVILLLLIVVECFLTGARAKDLSGKLFCFGLGSLIGFQSLVNLSVATCMLPNTGLTLPFVSYGLSSLISMYIGIGIVINVGLQRKKDLY